MTGDRDCVIVYYGLKNGRSIKLTSNLAKQLFNIIYKICAYNIIYYYKQRLYGKTIKTYVLLNQVYQS